MEIDMRKWWKVIASAVLAGTVISASMSAAGAEDVAGAQNASGTESAAGAQNAAGAESVSGAQNAAGAENAAVIEQSIISIATLAEMDVEANQAAILALLQGIAAQVEPGSDAAATTASIIALVQSGAGQKEAVLVLLDKLKGEIAGDASAPGGTAETVVTQTEGTGTVTAETQPAPGETAETVVTQTEGAGTATVETQPVQTETAETSAAHTDELTFTLPREDLSLPSYAADDFWWKLLSEDASVQVPGYWYSNDSGTSLVNYSDVSESGHISPAGGTLTTNYYPAETPAPDQALADYSGNMAKMKMVSDFREEDITALGLPGKHLVYKMAAGANDFLCETVCIDYEGTIYSVQMTQGAKSSYDYFPVFDNAVESFTVGEEAVRLVEEQPDHTETEAQTDAPQTETPQTDAPQTETPQTDTPQTETPQTDASQTESSGTSQTDTPQTEPPVSGDLSEFIYQMGGETYAFPTDVSGLAPASAWVDLDQTLEYKLTPDLDMGGLWTEISNTEYVFLQNTLYQEMVGITNMSGTDVTMRDGVLTLLVDTQGDNISVTLPGGVQVGGAESSVSAAYPAFNDLSWDGYAGIVGNRDMIYAKNVRDDGCNGYVLVRNDPPYYSSLSIICDAGQIREICYECLGSRKAGPAFGN